MAEIMNVTSSYVYILMKSERIPEFRYKQLKELGVPTVCLPKPETRRIMPTTEKVFYEPTMQS